MRTKDFFTLQAIQFLSGYFKNSISLTVSGAERHIREKKEKLRRLFSSLLNRREMNLHLSRKNNISWLNFLHLSSMFNVIFVHCK